MWSPVQTESYPRASRRWTSAHCSAGGCIESWAPKPITPSPRESVAHAAVHRQGAAGGLGGPVRGEEQHGLGDVLGKDVDAEQVALAIEVLEPLDGDPLGRCPLAADLVGPELRVLEDRVRIHAVRADAVGRALEGQPLGGVRL